MIDPVIFSVQISGVTISLSWYGVLVVLGVAVAAWIAAKGVKMRGGNADVVWDLLLWVVPAGIVGARLWYVVNDILGGNTRFLQDPLSIIDVTKGGLRGLHIYGALLFGAVAAIVFAHRRKMDLWMLLDSLGPSVLFGQAIARPANFINQELYGQPTTLPWGIPIDAAHRLPPWNDLGLFPEATTRFHPTFAYEMLWNFATGGLILWLARRFPRRMRPGDALAAWLIAAGLGRQIIEFFRPDQPRVPGTDVSWTRLAAALMIVLGALILLHQHEVLRLPFLAPARASYVAVCAAAPQEGEPPCAP
jgi:phosphatidylglycerol:prolipoprotein diacylglycerol transferase